MWIVESPTKERENKNRKTILGLSFLKLLGLSPKYIYQINKILGKFYPMHTHWEKILSTHIHTHGVVVYKVLSVYLAEVTLKLYEILV